MNAYPRNTLDNVYSNIVIAFSEYFVFPLSFTLFLPVDLCSKKQQKIHNELVIYSLTSSMKAAFFLY